MLTTSTNKEVATYSATSIYRPLAVKKSTEIRAHFHASYVHNS